MEEEQAINVSEIESRLNFLYSLKSHKIPNYIETQAAYKMQKLRNPTPWKSSFRMNTGFAIIQTKAAEILSSLNKYDFVAFWEEAKSNKQVVKLLWDFVWLISETDKNLFKIVMDSLKYGTGWWVEELVKITRTSNEPSKNADGTFSFEKKEITDYEGCRLTHIPWDSIYISGKTLDESTEAAYVLHWNRDEYLNVRGNNKMFSSVNEDIPKGKRYYFNTKITTNGTVSPTFIYGTNDTETTEHGSIISELHYFNKAKDEYVILANGIWVNPVAGKPMPFPSTHKEIPLVCFTDHYVEDDAYGLGEMEISQDSRNLKDALRSILLDVIKFQFGFTAIDPDSDFDQTMVELGLGKFARVAPKDIAHFAPNINANTAIAAEQKVDDDLMIETGVDFRNQLLSPSETAEKTKARQLSARKRIALSMMYNAYTFFARLAKLRMSNMQMEYSSWSKEIATKWFEVSPTGSSQSIGSGYGSFLVQPEMVKGKFLVLPNVGSLADVSTESDKSRFIEFVQTFGNMVDSDTGKPVINAKALIEASRGKYDGIDLDALLQNTARTKTPEQIMQEAGLNAEPMSIPWMEQQDPNFVPPAQRSWAKLNVPLTASVAK